MAVKTLMVSYYGEIVPKISKIMFSKGLFDSPPIVWRWSSWREAVCILCFFYRRKGLDDSAYDPFKQSPLRRPIRTDQTLLLFFVGHRNKIRFEFDVTTVQIYLRNLTNQPRKQIEDD